ncbi:MAG: hypothetical protein KDK55_03930 [Chlamydiia bacterium]|nr:hypothetical protein [Chlamydiia bacterium]
MASCLLKIFFINQQKNSLTDSQFLDGEIHKKNNKIKQITTKIFGCLHKKDSVSEGHDAELEPNQSNAFLGERRSKLKRAGMITFFVVTLLGSFILIPAGVGIAGIILPESGLAVISSTLTNAGIFALIGVGGMSAFLFFIGGIVTFVYIYTHFTSRIGILSVPKPRV